MIRYFVPYNVARPYVRDADCLQYRPPAKLLSVGTAIRKAGRGYYSHTAMAGWERDSLMCYEVREGIPFIGYGGGRVTLLSGQVQKFPRQIDIYRPFSRISYKLIDRYGKDRSGFATLDAHGAVDTMRSFANPDQYGWWNLWRASWAYLPFIRWFTDPPDDDELRNNKSPPFCSEAYAYALRANFADLIVNTPDSHTTPSDLTKSPIIGRNYVFTLDLPVDDPQPLEHYILGGPDREQRGNAVIDIVRDNRRFTADQRTG